VNIRAHIDIENASVEELKTLTRAYVDLIAGVGRAVDGRPPYVDLNGRSPDASPPGGPEGPYELCAQCGTPYAPPHDNPERCSHCPQCGTVRGCYRGVLPDRVLVRVDAPAIPPALQNPVGATLPPEQDVLATAQAIVNGQIGGTLSTGGPGSLNQPRRRPDPQRVQAVAGLLLDAHLGGGVALGKLEQVGAFEVLAEQVLAYLDGGGRPPPLVVRQADTSVPDVVRNLLDAELLAIAHDHVADAIAAAPPIHPTDAAGALGPLVAPNAVADASTPPAALAAAPVNMPPSPGAPVEPAGGAAPPSTTPQAPPVAPAAAAPGAPPRVMPRRPIADVERAMRLVLPHLVNLLLPNGGLVNYAAQVIARAGLPSHVPGGLTSTGERPLVHLARLTASTLVGLCATKHIGLQGYMERAHYAPGTDQATLPAPGMLGVDDGGRGNPFTDLNGRGAR
jgi:hypothetical protein